MVFIIEKGVCNSRHVCPTVKTEAGIVKSLFKLGRELNTRSHISI